MFLEYIWNDIEIDTPTIRAEINRLKKVLKEDFIVNVRGIGYMVKRPL
jgi:DNA-binding response OmpR family regulator